jgi:hypothetical protein
MNNVIGAIPNEMQDHIHKEMDGMKYTKNFRSATRIFI